MKRPVPTIGSRDGVYEHTTIKLHKDGALPHNVVVTAAESNPSVLHPAPFHVELAEWFIKIGSDKGDIVLDPFPFQGNTTNIEAVWMGVPIITLKANRYISPFGESINSNLNMSNWIAENYEDYILKAKKFSSNINELSKIRIKIGRASCMDRV